MATRSIAPTLRVNQVSAAIVSSAMRVHSVLGPGLLESAYDACLSHELRKRGFHVDTQLGLPWFTKERNSTWAIGSTCW
jgi:GxxExxY protein